MPDTEHRLYEELRAHANATRILLGNKMKPEREKSVCRAFLRTLGVTFNDNELIAPTQEPADVAFRDARFQVRDLLRGRQRGDLWKEKEKKFSEAQSLKDIVQPYTPPSPISLASLVPEVLEALSKKAEKYGAGCKDIDALVYVDLDNVFLEPNSPVPDTVELQRQGWRSVSLLFSPYCVVLFTSSKAPLFLRVASGKQCMEFKNISGLFDP